MLTKLDVFENLYYCYRGMIKNYYLDYTDDCKYIWIDDEMNIAEKKQALREKYSEYVDQTNQLIEVFKANIDALNLADLENTHKYLEDIKKEIKNVCGLYWSICRDLREKGYTNLNL